MRMVIGNIKKINQLTSFIDSTTVYGATSQHLNLLLDSDGMKLKMQPDANHGDLLPGLRFKT